MCNSIQKRQAFSRIIHTYKPDLILLQEDMVGRSYYPVGYQKICGIKSDEGLMNSILVKETLLGEVTYANSIPLATVPDIVGRTASTIVFRGLHICNLHLSGGRIDDKLYENITHLRDRQVSPFIKYDIVAGDFNGHPNKFPNSHPVYKSAQNKQLFKKYFSSGHKPLIENGMTRLTPTLPTDVFGGNPDHIYYNPKRVKPTTMHVINTIPLQLSDHNGIFVIFTL